MKVQQYSNKKILTTNDFPMGRQKRGAQPRKRSRTSPSFSDTKPPKSLQMAGLGGTSPKSTNVLIVGVELRKITEEPTKAIPLPTLSSGPTNAASAGTSGAHLAVKVTNPIISTCIPPSTITTISISSGSGGQKVSSIPALNFEDAKFVERQRARARAHFAREEDAPPTHATATRSIWGKGRRLGAQAPVAGSPAHPSLKRHVRPAAAKAPAVLHQRQHQYQ
jgi:hypothetical protein